MKQQNGKVVRLILVTLMGSDGSEECYVDTLHDLTVTQMFDGLQPGTVFRLELIEMSEEKYNNLPEFKGF